jgi:hypothetical protein
VRCLVGGWEGSWAKRRGPGWLQIEGERVGGVREILCAPRCSWSGCGVQRTPALPSCPQSSLRIRISRVHKTGFTHTFSVFLLWLYAAERAQAQPLSLHHRHSPRTRSLVRHPSQRGLDAHPQHAANSSSHAQGGSPWVCASSWHGHHRHQQQARKGRQRRRRRRRFARAQQRRPRAPQPGSGGPHRR